MGDWGQRTEGRGQRAEGRRQETTVGFRCRLREGGIWRGWIVPVGGSTPDRLRNYCWFPLSFDGGEIFGGGGSFRSGMQSPTGSGTTVGFRCRLTGRDIWRGWIVPVGDTIPDRLRNYCWFPLSFEGGGYLAGVDRSGRGFNPRPAPDRLRNYCWFPLSFDGEEIFGGGGSFRSGMQSPTGAKRRFAGGITLESG